MSHLVGNPEDWYSHVVAHMLASGPSCPAECAIMSTDIGEIPSINSLLPNHVDTTMLTCEQTSGRVVMSKHLEKKRVEFLNVKVYVLGYSHMNILVTVL